MKFLDELHNVLSGDKRFIGEDNQIVKIKVSDAARNNDEKLLKALLNNEILKDSLFKKIDDIYVFDINKFIWILESKEFLPDSFTMYKNKIGLVDSNNNLISQKEDVSLVWPYKDCVLEGGQTKEDQKREEIFYNETLAPDQINRLLAPKVLSNAKRYTKEGINENIEFNEDDNLIIKGNNLIALSSLLERYKGQVKCIYIDPPYNTGSDSFGYNDNFNHSTWLTFMKNRLELARELLKRDGVIFVQCDDNEQAYLKVLLDCIFGRDNFVNTLSVKMSPSSGVKRRFSDIKFIKNIEFLLVYKKESIKIRPINDPILEYDENYSIFFDGIEFTTLRNKIAEKFPLFSEVSMNEYLHIPEIKKYIMDNKNNIYRRDLASKWVLDKINDETLIFKSNEKKESRNFVWKVSNDSGDTELVFDIKSTRDVPYERLEPISWKIENEELTILRGDFWDGYDSDLANINKEGVKGFGQGQKPERLIKDILLSCTKTKDIVIDFYLGSGTTAAVAHKLNRKYIGVEQIYNQSNLILKRLTEVIGGDQSGISETVQWQGGGSFVYCELLEDNESLVSQLEMAENSEQVKVVLNKAIENGKLIPSILPSELKNTEEEFDKLSFDEQKNIIMELLNKNKLYVNLSDIDDEDYNVSEADKKFTRSFYGKE